MDGERDKSIVTVHTFLTSASDKMLAMEASLNQTSPRFGKSPIMFESWKLPFVMARRTCGLWRTLLSMFRFLKPKV